MRIGYPFNDLFLSTEMARFANGGRWGSVCFDMGPGGRLPVMLFKKNSTRNYLKLNRTSSFGLLFFLNSTPNDAIIYTNSSTVDRFLYCMLLVKWCVILYTITMVVGGRPILAVFSVLLRNHQKRRVCMLVIHYEEWITYWQRLALKISRRLEWKERNCPIIDDSYIKYLTPEWQNIYWYTAFFLTNKISMFMLILFSFVKYQVERENIREMFRHFPCTTRVSDQWRRNRLNFGSTSTIDRLS